MIADPEYLAGFFIGFLGSLHCLGMCGPIALVIPPMSHSLAGRLGSAFFYILGKTATYMLLGLLVGLLGFGLGLFKLQQFISLAIGIMILAYLFLPHIKSFSALGKWGMSVNVFVKRNMGNLLKQKSPVGLVALGFLNGMLPCGLVWLGLAGSLELGSAEKGAVFMFSFGLGTAPMLIGVMLMGDGMKSRFSKKLNKILPVFIFLMGLLFLLRGLGLGIPYVSPKLVEHGAGFECHEPSHRHP